MKEPYIFLCPEITRENAFNLIQWLQDDEVRKFLSDTNDVSAEIEQVVISALHDAYAEKAELDTPRILQALQNSPPLSVTMAESVAALRAWAQNRYVPAD